MAGNLDDVKRRILARVPLAELIGERVQLRLVSGKPVGCCPFHAEKSGSFYIYDDRYYCFGCKANGDAIEYVRKTEGIGYVESLRYLAGKYGVEAPELDEARSRMDRHRTDVSLYKLMTDTQEFFVDRLQGAAGDEARAYLERRGFSAANIAEFGFGLTPEEGFGLVRHLRSKGHKEQDMIDVSVATASTRDGRAYDFLRHRVTIPIRDPQGRLIAFGGRSLGDEQPKYKNSGNTKLFDKSHTLFGFDRARKVMRERGRAIVVEGYMDTLQLWQQGYPEAVACLGTAFTEGHLKQLKNATGVVILLFDGDSAGKRATLAAVNVALTAPEVQVKAVTLPDGLDPDDFVRRHGPEALEPLLAKAEPLLDFVVKARLLATDSLGIPELVSKEFIPWLSRITDRVQRDYLAHKIAHRTGVDLELLLAPVAAAAGQPTRAEVKAARAGADAGETLGVKPMSPLPPAVFDLFGHVFWSQPGELDLLRLEAFVTAELELEAEATEVWQDLTGKLAAGVPPSTLTIADLPSASIPGAAQLLAKMREAESAFACTDRPARLEKLLGHMRTTRVKATISALRAQVARLASLPGHEAEVAQLLKTVTELGRELNPHKA